MDGAAILFNEKKKILKISGESKAGDKLANEIKKGECQLIYTGAPVKGENKKIIHKENFEIKKFGCFSYKRPKKGRTPFAFKSR